MNVSRKANFEPRAERLPAAKAELDPPSSRREQQLRPWLRHTARTIRAAPEPRTVDRESPWDHVVSGRWSPIDSFESDGVLYVIAKRVSPKSVNALSPRAQAVLRRAAQGLSRKCIAYEIGVSQPTVSMIWAKTRVKLRAGSSAELARLLWVLRAAACSETAGSTGYWTIDHQEYAAFSACVETTDIGLLTPSERAVFQGVVSGFSTKEIASRRHVAERTLANQLASIFTKLHVGSRIELRARFAHCYREPFAATGSRVVEDEREPGSVRSG